ncbi:MAG: metalloregulator ArsR/SmtB family transcription factor [Myxococcota bacterium]|nr:metalloregulator ArsR/SmtB family transcription factor [Myxococcota bacterium]
MPPPRRRARAARELREILDSRLFRALCEPVRVEIATWLTESGPADVNTIASHFPQHQTVISRHLAILHEAGVLRRTKRGRHVYFEMDGPGMTDRMEKILERFRNIVPLCCPSDED